MSVVFQGVSKDDLAPPATRASKKAAKKAYEAILAQAEKEQLKARRQQVQAIIAAVCLGFGIHRMYLLRRQQGKCEKKRSSARQALAIMIEELVASDDSETRAMIACTTMMGFAAMKYCLQSGSFRCKFDEDFRRKVAAMISSLQD
jgi:hypothetical protein